MKSILIWVFFLSLCFSPISIVFAQSGGDSLKVPDFTPLETFKNNNLSINLTVDATGNLAKVPLNFSIVVEPSHGIIVNPIKIMAKEHRAVVIYKPNYNYTGPDSFSFKATVFNKNNSSNIGKISIIVNPPNSKLVFVATPEQRAGLAFGSSLIIVFFIFLSAYLIVRRVRKTKKLKPNFWDIIRDDSWYPSLAIFQFLLWTSIVLFAYFGIYLTRLFSGSALFMDIPEGLVLVMGISAAVTVTNGAVSKVKYGETTPPNEPATKEVPSDQIRKKLPGFKTMLMENDKITLSRFQMFAWTWIGIIAYLGLLFWEVDVKLLNIENLLVPGLPILFVSLMGLSQVTYITAKSVKPKVFSVNEVRPRKIQLQKENNLITILGSNFGDKGTVWVEYYPPLTAQEKIELGYEGEGADEYVFDPMRLKEQFEATIKPPREDSRIVVNLDSIKDKLKAQSYVVRVEKDGLLTYANRDATLEINNPPIAVDLPLTSTVANKPVDIMLQASDPDKGDIIRYSIETNPSHGTLSLDPITGKVSYASNKDYVGDDGFTYKANDGKVDSNIAKVTIKVDKPVAIQ
jgi:Big-like domain-containing protein